MVQDPSVSVSIYHVAICVSDLERATRFYTRALGFEVEKTVEFDAPFEVITELPIVKARANFFFHPSIQGLKFEVLEYTIPGFVGPADRRPINQLGISHFGMEVADLEAVGARIETYGGRVHWHTRVSTPLAELVFATDPDGVRLELLQRPAPTSNS